MIHFLYGPNSYALLRKVQQLQRGFIAEYDTHGLERIDGENYPPERLPELLQGMSLFASHRMVILKNASQQRALWEALADWADKTLDEVQLVLVEANPDKRTKTFKALTKFTNVYVAENLSEGQATTWLVEEATSRNGHLTRKDAQFLIGRVGLDQGQLSSELDKLVVHDAINEGLIIDLTEASPHSTAFELLDAVIAAQPQRTKNIIDEIKGSEDPYKLFGLFSSQVHTLALVVAAGSKISAQQVAKDSGTHPFVISKISKAAHHIGWGEAKQIIDTTAELDDRMKSSGIDPWVLLESALIKTASR